MKYGCCFCSRPQEVFNWLLSIDDRDYDVWDKGKISWQVQYRRTNGPKDRVSLNAGVNDYGHGGYNILEDISLSKDDLESKQETIIRKAAREKRGIEIIKNAEDGFSNIDTLKLTDSISTISEDLPLDHHDSFPERDRDKYRLRAKLSIMKDDVQTVLPIANKTVNILVGKPSAFNIIPE